MEYGCHKLENETLTDKEIISTVCQGFKDEVEEEDKKREGLVSQKHRKHS